MKRERAGRSPRWKSMIFLTEGILRNLGGVLSDSRTLRVVDLRARITCSGTAAMDCGNPTVTTLATRDHGRIERLFKRDIPPMRHPYSIFERTSNAYENTAVPPTGHHIKPLAVFPESALISVSSRFINSISPSKRFSLSLILGRCASALFEGQFSFLILALKESWFVMELCCPRHSGFNYSDSSH
jgi:hypothetical protein